MKSNVTEEPAKGTCLQGKVGVGNPNGAIKASLIFVAIISGIAFAYFAWPVVLPFILALVVAITLKPAVTWLRSHHLAASLASLIVLGTLLLVLCAVAYWLGRPAVAWVKSAPEKVPQLKQKFNGVLQPVMKFSAAMSSAGTVNASASGTTNAPPAPASKEGNHMIGAVFTWTRSLLAGIAEAIVLTFLLLMSGDSFQRRLVQQTSGSDEKKRAAKICQEVEQSVSSYLSTVSVINIGIGTVASFGFWIVGMPNAAMWGGVVCLLNFLPFFGPILGMAIVGLAGLLAFDTVALALLPVAVYVVLHLAETYLVTPFALEKRFRLNPVGIFIAFIFFSWLWGVFGALLAMPLLVSFKVVCERIPNLSSISVFLDP